MLNFQNLPPTHRHFKYILRELFINYFCICTDLIVYIFPVYFIFLYYFVQYIYISI